MGSCGLDECYKNAEEASCLSCSFFKNRSDQMVMRSGVTAPELQAGFPEPKHVLIRR